jgi:glycosyltransferase involved in cell wall biosynthesis
VGVSTILRDLSAVSTIELERPTRSKPIRVLQVHAFYQRPGGEDVVLAAEHEVLARNGHYVAQYTVRNDLVAQMSGIAAGVKTVWNADTGKQIRFQVAQHRPDVIHAHNIFPLISPALYYAAAQLGIPVVQTLHNYRLICPSATLFRNGAICEDCLYANPFHGVLHGCYRESRLASAAVASQILVHSALGTWRNRIDRYIALTEFSKAKFVESGVPAEKVTVKPNFLPSDPGEGEGNGGYALYVGRLSIEKGLFTLLKAWRNLRQPIPLKIAGDGPLIGEVQKMSHEMPQVSVLGQRSKQEIIGLLQGASALIFPSEWYECLAMTVVEALACGTPVIASNLASLREAVTDGKNGAFFPTGSAEGLAACVDAWFRHPDGLRVLRTGARQTFLEKFTGERNYPQLLAVYEQVLNQSATPGRKM